VALRSFKSPLAVCQGGILLGIIWALDDVAAAGHVVVALVGAVQLIGPVATIVFAVAAESRVDAPLVRTVEGS